MKEAAWILALATCACGCARAQPAAAPPLETAEPAPPTPAPMPKPVAGPSPGIAVAAPEATGPGGMTGTKTPAEWVAAIKVRAAADEPGRELRMLRLAAGRYLTHGCAAKKGAKLSRDRGEVQLREFMSGRGKAILAKLRAGEELAGDEEPYRDVVRAAWLMVGVAAGDKKNKTRGHPYYLADVLSLTKADTDEAKKYVGRAYAHGPSTLYRGYVEGKLDAGDIDDLRLYRLVCASRGVGECQHAYMLGLHPRAPARHKKFPFWGGGYTRNIRRRIVGTPLLDLRLPRMETVRARPGYSDVARSEYGFRYPLRPEGVLEFLEPMAGTRRGKDVKGVPTVEAVMQPPGERDPPGYESFGALTGEKPLLIFANAAEDEPMSWAFGIVPTLLKSYEDAITWRFVTVTIHDWYYASRHWRYFTEESRGYHTQHHSWSEEERARRMTMRLVQHPQHDNVRILIDNNHQHFKDRYASGGGQNQFWLFGTDGVVKHHNGNAFKSMLEINRMECALARLLKSGGAGAMATTGDQLVELPRDPVLAVRGARARSFDDGTVLADWRGGTLRVRLTAHAGVTLDGRTSTRGALKAGDAFTLVCRLGDQKEVRGFTWPQTRTWKRPEKPSTFAIGAASLTVVRKGGAQTTDHDVLEIVKVEGLESIVACGMRAQRDRRLKSALRLEHREGHTYRGGVVKAVDASRRTITVTPWSYDANALSGRRILEKWKDEGTVFYLDEDTKGRHACLERWLAAAGADEMYYLDDAVAYTLNGRFVAGFDDITAGDRVTVRYRTADDSRRPIPVSMLRISRIAGK